MSIFLTIFKGKSVKIFRGSVAGLSRVYRNITAGLPQVVPPAFSGSPQATRSGVSLGRDEVGPFLDGIKHQWQQVGGRAENQRLVRAVEQHLHRLFAALLRLHHHLSAGTARRTGIG